VAAVGTVLITVGAGGAQAAGGALDPSFGRAGIVLTDINGDFGHADALAVQADGRIVAAGAVYADDNFDFAVVRYTRTGMLDTSFGRGGVVMSDFAARSNEEAEAIAVQRDGKILVVGTRRARDTEGDFALARYTRAGAPDVSFGRGGKVLTDIRGRSYDRAAAVAVQADGRIVVAGSSSAGGRGEVAIVRYTSGGRLDPSFGRSGKVLSSFGGKRDDGASDVALQQDGRIVAAGWSGDPGQGRKRIALIRYLTSGELDGSFGTGGKVLTSFSDQSDDGANALAVQKNGKIVVAGWSNGDFDSGWSGEGFALVRYTRGGKLDATFGTGGKVLIVPGTASVAQAVVVQRDGKIVAVGDNGKRAHPSRDFVLVRYTTSGDPDASFGRGGKVLTDLGGGSSDGAAAVALQRDGRILAAGSSSAKRGDFALARYTK
jgi:uncharacterized delta-60 repeat protein